MQPKSSSVPIKKPLTSGDATGTSPEKSYKPAPVVNAGTPDIVGYPGGARAIIYTRVSQDTSGYARSVTEQERECRTACQRNGWTVIDVVSDNDIGASRWSQKKRPGYKRLRGMISSADVVVAWESSRVTRIPRETEDLMDLCTEPTERTVLLCYSGTVYNPSKPADRMLLRITGAASAHEADLTRERVLRGVRARMAEGKPHGRMPYGYRRKINPHTGIVEKWIPDEDAAPIIKEIVRRVLHGETLYTITKDLDDRGVKTPSMGGSRPHAESWIPRRVRVMTLSPTYAGLRTHKGEVVGKGTWEPLITEDEHRRLTAILTNPARKTTLRRGSTPEHLLTGIIKCGNDGSGMRWFGPKSLKTPRYECETCYLGRRADKVDELIVNAMLDFLTDPRAVANLRSAATDASAIALERSMEHRQQIEALRTEFIDDKVSAASFAAIESELLAKIDVAEAEVRHAFTNPLLAQLAGEADVVAAWEALPLTGQRDAIRAALDIRVLPQPAMGRRFDPQYVQVQWLD